jgi:hypothetical protein
MEGKMRRMSEDEVERRVERMVDALDRRFMNGKMDQAQYDVEMAKIDAWYKAAWRAPAN